jgi:catechol 2,3-dioxygenase-like lactoylglutathione lyase family enzyme
MPSFTGVSHIALTVTDVDKSRDWYVDVLGCQHMMDTDRGDIKGRLMIHPAGLMIGMTSHAGQESGGFSEKRVGLDHLSFNVASREELGEWEKHLAAKGVTYSEIQDEYYGSVLVFRDPDGIQLEMFTLPAGAPA